MRFQTIGKSLSRDSCKLHPSFFCDDVKVKGHDVHKNIKTQLTVEWSAFFPFGLC